MRIISKARLKESWEKPEYQDSEADLKAWHTLCRNRNMNWQNFGDVKNTIAKASLVGDCVVFNIRGNEYRLITRIRYQSHAVYILAIMTHREYDQKKWIKDCGCHKTPQEVTQERQKKASSKKKKK